MNTYLPPVKNDTKMTRKIYLSTFWPCFSWCRVVHASGRVESRFYLSEALGSLRSNHGRKTLQRELGEVWDDMRRLLDPGAVVALEEFQAVTPGGGDKAVDISREFFTSGEAGEYVLVRDFNAAAKRAGLDATAVDLDSLGYMKRQKKIDGKNEYVIQGIRLC